METILALGVLGLLAAVGWSMTDRSRSDRRAGRPGTPPPPPPIRLLPPPPVDPAGEGGGSGSGVAREHEVADDAASAGVDPPSIAAWSAILAPMAVAADLQLPYVLKWVTMESGGNPCEVGDPRQHGPDGQPREVGIAQFYNPDDLTRAGTAGSALRAYCVPGDQHVVRYKGKVVRGFSQAMIRALTPAEMAQQATMTIGLVSDSARDATRDLAAVHAGAGWGRSRRDFWTLVKLRHGLPGLSRSGLAAVTKRLGRPPSGWREFRANLALVQLDPKTEAYRGEFDRILDNAEQCASVFAERSVA